MAAIHAITLNIITGVVVVAPTLGAFWLFVALACGLPMFAVNGFFYRLGQWHLKQMKKHRECIERGER